MELITRHLQEAKSTLENFLNDQEKLGKVQEAAGLMVEAIKNDNKIFSCGNGGSMCDAMHFSEELVGKFRDERKALPAIAIGDPSYLSCTSNDFGYAHVFSRYLEGLGRKGDVLLGISTSGNSQNVLNAIDVARNKEMKVIGLTGKNGGKMASLCDVEIRAPHSQYADRAQELHIKIIHIFIDAIEKALGLSKS